MIKEALALINYVCTQSNKSHKVLTDILIAKKNDIKMIVDYIKNRPEYAKLYNSDKIKKLEEKIRIENRWGKNRIKYIFLHIMERISGTKDWGLIIGAIVCLFPLLYKFISEMKYLAKNENKLQAVEFSNPGNVKS